MQIDDEIRFERNVSAQGSGLAFDLNAFREFILELEVAAAAPIPSGAMPISSFSGTDSSDIVIGTFAQDTLSGGDGDDTVVGLSGDDELYGDAGSDILLGSNGNDVLSGGDGFDVLSGGVGEDLFVLGDGVNVIVDFEAGIDRLFLPNANIGLIDVIALSNGTVLVSFGSSATQILNTTVAAVEAAFVEQTVGFVQINPDGWGDPEQVYAWSQLVYDGFLYVSTLNLDGTQIFPGFDGAAGLYRYHGATDTWETVSDDGLGNLNNDGIRNMVEFGGAMYLGTLNTRDGAELLKSVDGLTFETVITGGFGNPDLEAVRALHVFDNALYVGFQSYELGVPLMLLRSEDGTVFEEVTLPRDPNFVNNSSLHTMTTFDGYLYAATRNVIEGFELYRSADGVTFETVIGQGGAIPNGVTGAANTLVYHMIEFQGALYLGTGNFLEGFAIYRSFDGLTFEQIGENGFGDPGNAFAWRFHVYEDQLYLGTNYDGEDPSAGGNLYRTSDGETWETLVGPGGTYDMGGFNDATNWGIRSFGTYEDSLYIGTANDPYFTEGASDAIGAQIFEFIGEASGTEPEYLF